MPLKHILRNKLQLQKNFHLQECSIDSWPFWQFEENIKIVNEIMEDEDNQRKTDEEGQQSSMPNMDSGAMMKNAQNMTNNMQMPKL
jgi:hypothetical protein